MSDGVTVNIVYLHCRLLYDRDCRRILPWLTVFLRLLSRHHMFTCTYDHSFRNRMAYSMHTYMAPTATTNRINYTYNIAHHRGSLSSSITFLPPSTLSLCQPIGPKFCYLDESVFKINTRERRKVNERDSSVLSLSYRPKISFVSIRQVVIFISREYR